MKLKSLLLLLLVTVIHSAVYAERPYAEHALMVKRLSCWAPDYLTVTNNWDNLFFSGAPSTLKTLSVITEINGESTKDMEPQDFYAILDRSSTVSLKYMTKIRGENKSYAYTLSKKKGILWCDYCEGYITKESFLNRSYPEDDMNNYFSYEKRREIREYKYEYGPSAAECTSMMADPNIDLFQFNTFDYMVTDEDYTMDLGLVQSIAKELEKKGLRFEPDKPDLHIYLTKNIDASIESIYVPNIVSETTSSSRTIGRMHIYYGNYNTWGRGSSNTTSRSSTQVSDNGVLKTLADGDLYVQIAILDAQKMDGARPPVVWQMVHKRHFTTEFNAIEKIKELHVALHWYPLPEVDDRAGVLQTFGLFFQEKLSKSGIVSDVADGSWASNNGIQPGFVLQRVKSDKGSKYNVGKEKYEFWYSPLNADELKFDKLKTKHTMYDERTYFYIPEKLLKDY